MARSFKELVGAAHKARYAALTAGREYRGHFLVTVDEFIEIATNTQQFDMDNTKLSGLDVGVVPNDWDVAA